MRFVVVGGSIAAVTAAGALREHGFEGPLTVVSDEQHAPYSRVPLSKGFLSGADTPSTITLPGLPGDVDLRLGAGAGLLDAQRSRLRLQGGEELPYDRLLICSGARAKRLTAPGRSGEHAIRTIDDVLRLRDALASARTAIVIGGGFLGTEAASTLAGLGLSVNLVTMSPPLVSHLGEWMAEALMRRARRSGVGVESMRSSVELLGDPVTGIRVDGDRVIEADVVVTAIGDIPNTDWLAGSGLDIRDGVRVDRNGRVDASIGAAGDVATSHHDGRAVRIPNWTNAVMQSRHAARALLTGEETPPQLDDYHWTEQFGVDLKISGRMRCKGDPVVMDGDPEGGGALLLWTHEDGTRTAVAMNYRLPIVKLKRLGARHVPGSPEPATI